MRYPIVKSIVIDNQGSVDKGKEKRIVIRIMELNTYRYQDIRTFVFVNGVWQATAKGITLNKHTYPIFMDILDKSRETTELALNAQTPEQFEQELKRSKKSKKLRFQ